MLTFIAAAAATVWFAWSHSYVQLGSPWYLLAVSAGLGGLAVLAVMASMVAGMPLGISFVGLGGCGFAIGGLIAGIVAFVDNRSGYGFGFLALAATGLAVQFVLGSILEKALQARTVQHSS